MRNLLIFCICLQLMWCSNTDVAEINLLMTKQEEDWNNGDIDGFMEPYWLNDSLMFIGSSGLTYGWQKVLENYKKSYPDTSAMGKLTFKVVKVTPFGNEYCSVVGKWSLLRIDDNPSGHFSLIWKRINGEWKIVMDHSS